MSAAHKDPLVNLLKGKDRNDDELNERFAHYDYVASHKNEFFLQFEEQSLHNKNLMNHCIKPCVTNL